MDIKNVKPVLLLATVLLLAAGCEEQRKANTAPPPQAMAPEITAPAPEPPKVEPPPQQAVVPDPVDTTIAQAEKEFQDGRANYAAGHLDAAKQNFDKAFEILTQGPVSVRSNEKLKKEFDKVVEGINSLEVEALKKGDGFTEQKAEPAPIDEANEVTFPVDPNIKAKAAAELANTHSDLPLVMNDTVAGYINFYSTRGRGTLERALVRAGKYREMIEKTFREEGVPQDLIYLAQAESGFQPLALSRTGARGIWQFMAGRASEYGMTRNWWLDERQDPAKATRAAARHLKDLYTQFGDWYLAMAAYNCGPGNVQAAVRRTGYADFWQLYKRDVLPRETKNYVPIIVAMTIMAKNPAQYGLENIYPDRPAEVDTVSIDYPVDLRLVSEIIDVPAETLQEFNPSLLRMTTPKDGTFDLRLPAGTKDKYLATIAAIPADKRVLWRYHKVESGETLASIAKKYHTTPAQISNVNGLEEDDIQAETRLIIPMSGSRDSDGLIFSKRPTRYRVRRGDTVLSVADDFGVPPERLRRWNRLKGNELRKGRSIVIYRPVADGSKEAAAAPVRHRARHSKKPASASGTPSKSLKGSGLSEAKTPPVKKKKTPQG
ncbi:MAG: transglycosylase SLT domain-containing protein [Terriglobales bacterium]|jgi:membrane-bound lytic murein transglycosylase D